MKKRIIALLIFLVLCAIPSLIYWKSLATKVVLSALDLRYGLSLHYDAFDLSVVPGRVSMDRPLLLDSLQSTSVPLATANGLSLYLPMSKVVHGEFDMRRIRANQLSLEFFTSSEGELNWANVLKRFRNPKANARTVIARAQNETPLTNSAVPTPLVVAPAVVETASAPQSATDVIRASTPQVVSPTASVTPKVKSPKTVSGASPQVGAQNVAKPTSADSSASEKLLHPPKIPVIEIDDLSLNYNERQQSETYSIRMERFSFDPRTHEMEIDNGRVLNSGQGNSRLIVKKLTFGNAFAEPGSKLDIVADAVHLNGRQTGERQYDFTTTTRIWVNVYRRIEEAVSGRKPKKEGKDFPIASIEASNLSASVVPQNGTEGTPSALFLRTNRLSYRLSNDELVLSGVTLNEAGRDLMHLDRIVLGGLASNNIEIRKIAIDGGRLDLFESADGELNASRAIQRIRDIIQSIAPESSQTAYVNPFSFETLQSASFVDSSIQWSREGGLDRRLAVERLQYDASTRILDATGFLMARSDGDKKTVVSVPSFVASPEINIANKTWNYLVLNQPEFNFNWRSNRFELVDAASDWISLPGLVFEKLDGPKDDAPPEPFLIRDLQLKDSVVLVKDFTIEPSVLHRMNSFNLQWKDVRIGDKQAPMTPLVFESALSEPSPGSFAFQGVASPAGFPLNVTGTAMLVVSNIAAFNPYLQASEKALPIRIVKGGLRSSARASIQDNKVNGIVDLYLYDPQFAPNESKWPLKLDQKTVIASLNNMKDKNGVIAFPNNKWSGDVHDPKFKRGLGINDLLWSNVQGAITTVLKLPLDIVGSVGNVFMKILGQERQ